MADLSVLVQSEVDRPRDRIYGITRSVQSQNARSAGLAENPLHLAETVTAVVNTSLSVSLTETIRSRDWIYGSARDSTAAQRTAGLVEGPVELSDGGRAEFIGPGAALKISDQVSVWMSDIYQAEAMRVADFIYGAALGPPATTLSVGLREQAVEINEFLAQLIILVVPAESVRIAAGPGVVDLIDSFDPVLHIQDTVTAALQAGTDLNRAVTDESLKVSDSLTVLENPESAEPALDSLRLVDQVLGPTLTPEQTSGFDDTIKISDSVTTQLTQLLASGFDETLHVVDTDLSASMGGLSVVVTQESLKLQDSAFVLENPEQTSGVDEALRVSDSVAASLDQEQVSGVDENLKVSESVSAQLTKLFASGFDELVHLVETDLSVSMGGLLAFIPADTARVQDAVTVVEDPEQANGFNESLKVQETVSGLLNPEQASGFDELLRVQDAASAQLLLLLAFGFDELFHVQDTVQATEGSAGLINANPGDEPLHVQDQPFASITPEFSLVTADTLKLADVVTAALQLAEGTTVESAKLADAVTVSIGLDAGALLETLHLQDVVVESRLSPLLVTVTDLLFIGETLNLGTGAPISAAFVTDFVIVPAPGHLVIVPAPDRLVLV